MIRPRGACGEGGGMVAGQPPGNDPIAQDLGTFVADLEVALSLDRLAPFRPGGGDDLAMVATYLWNVAISRELYTSLASLEVVMRNGIHGALSAHFNQPDWYDQPGLLLPREQKDVAVAKRSIRRSNHPNIPPRVVATLNFGFWTSILDKAYGNRIWTPPPPAQSLLIPHAFPHAPAHFQTRGRAHGRFNAIRKLRNRIFHYEPIWSRTDLLDRHREIIESIGWVSPTLQAATVVFDRFPDVFLNGRTGIVTELKAHLGIK